MQGLKLNKNLFFGLSGLLLVVIVIYLPLHWLSVFESPDENGNYLTTRMYAETGRFWYVEDFTDLDRENYLHPRQFVSHMGRVVPVQFWGLPVIYAPLYSFVSDQSVTIWAVVFSLFAFFFFIKLSQLLFGSEKGKYAALLFIATLPLLFYFSQPYFNASGAIAFFICGLYFLARYNHYETTRDVFLSSFFFSISIFFRFENIIFIGLIFIICLINKYRTSVKNYARPSIIAIASFTLFTLIPILALNYEVYGKAFTLGTQLLEANSVGRESSTLFKFLLPHPVIPSIIWGNVYRLIFMLLPLASLLAVLGIISRIKRRGFDLKSLLYGLVCIYVVIYAGSSYTWMGLDMSYIGINTSIVRYWLMGYVFILVVAVIGFSMLKRLNRGMALLLAGVLLVTSVSGFLVDNPRSVMKLLHARSGDFQASVSVRTSIDEKSVVYSDIYDKILAPFGVKTAGWWASENTYDPDKLVTSMSRLYTQTSYSVYLYTPSSYVDVIELNYLLKEKGLLLKDSSEVKYLYKLEEIPSE